MAGVEEHLQRWAEAGVLDDASAERIRAFEHAQRDDRRPDERDSVDRPGVLEVLIYLGVAIFAVGIIVLTGQSWDDLRPPARIAVLGVSALLALAAGAGLRLTGEPQLVRGGNLTWLAATVLATGAVAISVNEADADDRTVLLLAALAAVTVALALWAIAASYPQVAGLGAALFLLGESLGNWPDEYSSPLAGGMILVFGAAGLVLTELRLVKPLAGAAVVFALLAAIGSYHAGIPDQVLWAELLTFAVGAAIIALGVWRARYVYLVIGVALVFVNLVTFIFEYFEDEVGVPVAFMLSGALVIGGVLLLVQARSLVRHRRREVAS